MLIHNEYGQFSGEEAVVENLSQLLTEYGHEVIQFRRSSTEIPQMFFGKFRAFFSGIYSVSSKKTMREYLRANKPDIIHIHNLFPLISPSILPECKKAGMPVVMTVHNYRLICPNGLFMTNGLTCEECKGGKEYNCLLNNCEGSYFKSMGYFLRSAFARKFRFFKDNVTVFACLTGFQRQKLIEEGFASERIVVVPNMVEIKDIHPSKQPGDYVGFVGRISPEKGVDILVRVAEKLKDIAFKATGAYDRMKKLVDNSPDNFEFVGPVQHERTSVFYESSRFIVLPSICYEGFPGAIVEAMVAGKPVIASQIGGIPEIVDEGVTGLLFEPGNAAGLAEKIRYLWERPELCHRMGLAGRKKALREYSEGRYYSRLMRCYHKALEMVKTQRLPGKSLATTVT